MVVKVVMFTNVIGIMHLSGVSDEYLEYNQFFVQSSFFSKMSKLLQLVRKFLIIIKAFQQIVIGQTSTGGLDLSALDLFARHWIFLPPIGSFCHQNLV